MGIAHGPYYRRQFQYGSLDLLQCASIPEIDLTMDISQLNAATGEGNEVNLSLQSPIHSSTKPSLPTADAEGIQTSLRQDWQQQPGEELEQQARSLSWRREVEWLQTIKRHSQLLVAVVDVAARSLDFANNNFLALAGFPSEKPDGVSYQSLLAIFSVKDQAALQECYRRHVLNAILDYRYQTADLIDGRLLNEPVVVAFPESAPGRPHRVELRLQSDRLTINALSSALAAQLDACWSTPPDKQQVMAQLLNPASPLSQLTQTLQPDEYQIEGGLLLEGMEVTDREVAKSLIQLLVGRESVLQPRKFTRANELMKTLFRAQDSLIVSSESDQTTLFMGLDKSEWDVHLYSVRNLHNSLFFQAADRNQVLNIPDLSLESLTDCEKTILEAGVRSLLIIPLVMKSTARGSESRQLLGLVGLTSDLPYAFDSTDCTKASTLIPALAAAMRHMGQDRFTNIHPSVRWRFEQETERRSWGLAPEPIVFSDVYPLYGISDIRGSSNERNRAIQADLLAQFELGLAVIEAVCDAQENAFARQFRCDLLAQIEHLQTNITVDAEVTMMRYLQNNLETHFDYFCQCSPAAQAAVTAYQTACDNEQKCVYAARAVYDRTINQINSLLRATWNRRQQEMQIITRHYCDVEATDGIDHMIYAGQSIDPKFSEFHLRSLRYEQLRAVCDCARVAFDLKTRCDTDMEITHLVLVQDLTVDISHDENTERLFDVRGAHDTRYEIVKKRIDKAMDAQSRERITQPGKLTLVYSTAEEWEEYSHYFRYLQREGWIAGEIEFGVVEALQGVTGLKFSRVRILPVAENLDSVS